MADEASVEKAERRDLSPVAGECDMLGFPNSFSGRIVANHEDISSSRSLSCYNAAITPRSIIVKLFVEA